jgi:N-methylhydantoinase A
VQTVSAGGGSIAWIDDAGALRVGPQSAGAVPGPAAFGRGGRLPTVTDAHVTLGRITESRMSGGVALDAAAARASVDVRAARRGRPARRVAEAIVATADATMARALRRVSVERGVDPRDCVLVAFGGGGPLHACALADILGIQRVIVPPFAGVLSALGLAMTAERREVMASVLLRLDEWPHGARRSLLVSLRQALPADLAARSWFARMRYAGQGHELDVPLTPASPAEAIASAFETLHERRYGFCLPAPLEVVSVRHVAGGSGRPVRFAAAGRRRPVPGPRAVALEDATMFVAKGWRARPAAGGAWELRR